MNDATPKQKRKIAMLAHKLGDKDLEYVPMNKGLAGRVIRELVAKVEAKKRKEKSNEDL